MQRAKMILSYDGYKCQAVNPSNFVLNLDDISGFLKPEIFSYCRVGQAASKISVATRPLTEPDKRLSHTSGSSVNRSESLRPTTWIQVFADIRFGPPNPL